MLTEEANDGPIAWIIASLRTCFLREATAIRYGSPPAVVLHCTGMMFASLYWHYTIAGHLCSDTFFLHLSNQGSQHAGCQSLVAVSWTACFLYIAVAAAQIALTWTAWSKRVRCVMFVPMSLSLLALVPAGKVWQSVHEHATCAKLIRCGQCPQVRRAAEHSQAVLTSRAAFPPALSIYTHDRVHLSLESYLPTNNPPLSHSNSSPLSSPLLLFPRSFATGVGVLAGTETTPWGLRLVALCTAAVTSVAAFALQAPWEGRPCAPAQAVLVSVAVTVGALVATRSVLAAGDLTIDSEAGVEGRSGRRSGGGRFGVAAAGPRNSLCAGWGDWALLAAARRWAQAASHALSAVLMRVWHLATLHRVLVYALAWMGTLALPIAIAVLVLGEVELNHVHPAWGLLFLALWGLQRSTALGEAARRTHSTSRLSAFAALSSPSLLCRSLPSLLSLAGTAPSTPFDRTPHGACRCAPLSRHGPARPRAGRGRARAHGQGPRDAAQLREEEFASSGAEEDETCHPVQQRPRRGRSADSGGLCEGWGGRREGA